MKTNTTTRLRGRRLPLAVAVLGAVVLAAPVAPAQSSDRRQFKTPDEAIAALAAAAKAHDRGAIAEILGKRADDLMTGDTVRDRNELDKFANAVAEKVTVERGTNGRAEFVLGNVEWPFAIPAVAAGDSWRFDTESGIDELLTRRIGAGELAAVASCRAYALAQWEYFTGGDWDRDGVAEYSQRFRSSEGARDGLYWKTSGGDDPSPLGILVARGEASGYRVRDDVRPRFSAPYNGYRFKILARQGEHAAGGAYSYVINGNMIAGFALVAYPVEWKNTGVMTFVINQQGRVYQKNLGPKSESIAEAMDIFDPDTSWTLVGK